MGGDSEAVVPDDAETLDTNESKFEFKIEFFHFATGTLLRVWLMHEIQESAPDIAAALSAHEFEEARRLLVERLPNLRVVISAREVRPWVILKTD